MSFSQKQAAEIEELEAKVALLEKENLIMNEDLWQILTMLSHGNVAVASRRVSEAIDRRRITLGG